jgi:hypothetical protein
VTVAAEAFYVRVEDVIAAEGPRDPASGPETLRLAFVLLLFQDEEVTEEELGEVDSLRAGLEAGWDEAVRGLQDLDTTLGTGTATELFPDAEDTGAAPPACSCAGAGRGPWAAGALLLAGRRQARGRRYAPRLTVLPCARRRRARR